MAPSRTGPWWSPEPRGARASSPRASRRARASSSTARPASWAAPRSRSARAEAPVPEALGRPRAPPERRPPSRTAVSGASGFRVDQPYTLARRVCLTRGPRLSVDAGTIRRARGQRLRRASLPCHLIERLRTPARPERLAWSLHSVDRPRARPPAARQHFALTHPSNLRAIRTRIVRASSTTLVHMFTRAAAVGRGGRTRCGSNTRPSRSSA